MRWTTADSERASERGWRWTCLERLAQAAAETARILNEIDARLSAGEDPGVVIGDVTRDLHALQLALES